MVEALWLCLFCLLANGLPLEYPHLPQIFHYPETATILANASLPVHWNRASEQEILFQATTVVAQVLNVSLNDLSVQQHFIHGSVLHVYFIKLAHGFEILNHNAHAIIKNGNLLKLHSSFGHGKALHYTLPKDPPFPRLNLKSAVKIAEEKLGLVRDDFPAKLQYLQTEEGYLSLVHVFQLKTFDDSGSRDLLQASVDATTGEIRQLYSYAHKLVSYNIVMLPNLSPLDGFNAFSPNHSVASPQGWNTIGNDTFHTTTGNNVDVVINDAPLPSRGSPIPPKQYYRPDGVDEFNSNWNSSEPADSVSNRRASSIQLFYLVNFMHDMSYNFGFTEAAGNFQENNFGRGGNDSDSVLALNQAKDDVNNARMIVPPDGQRGELYMYLFNRTLVTRDGALETMIPLHEYTHGISNRLTGGARNGLCLLNIQSKGMNEGWSDAMSLFLTKNENSTRYMNVIVGAWVTGNPNGIRRFPYSTDIQVNPLLFSSINEVYSYSQSHQMGEIWTSLLNEVFWNIVDTIGFSNDWLDHLAEKGNIVMMQLMIGGLMLQPCNPNFLQARDAIITADEIYYKGKFACQIWKGFAKRGMGIDAEIEQLPTPPKETKKFLFKNGFSPPKECK